MSHPLLVMTTYPELEGARKLAADLIKSRLAACVNVLPRMESFYYWDNQLEHGEEHLLIIKTQDALYLQLEAAIAGAHPYELPEIIALPISRGLPEYINWIAPSSP